MKTLTYDQVALRKEKAARFVRDVLGEDDRADQIENESVEDYADRRKFTIVNPAVTISKRRISTVPKTPSKDDLMQQIQDLQDENDELRDQLDQIADIAAPEDDDDESDDYEDDDQGN